MTFNNYGDIRPGFGPPLTLSPQGGGPYYDTTLYNPYAARNEFGATGGTSAGAISDPFASGPLPRPATAFAQNAADFYGSPRPISFGRRSLQGRHIWASDIRWSGDSGRVDFAVAFGEQGVPEAELARVDVLRVWANDQIIVDRRVTSTMPIDPDVQFSIYPGNFTQNPDPLISEGVGAAQAIAFRGTIYMVFRDFPLKKFGFNQIPFIRAEVSDILTTTTEIVEYTKFAATPQNLDLDGAIVDWVRQRFYVFEDQGSGVWGIHTYSTATNAQIATSNFSFTPIIDVSENVGYDPFFGNIFVTSGSGNTKKIHVVNPITGLTIGTYGTNSSNLTNDIDGFVNAKHYATVAITGTLGEPEYITFIGSSLDNLGFLRYEPLATEIDRRLRWTGWPGGNVTHGNVQAVILGEKISSTTEPVAVAYACDEREVYRITVPAGQDFNPIDERQEAEDAKYTVIHDVGVGNIIARMWLDPKYGHLLITYTDGSSNRRIKRIQATDAFLSGNETGTSIEYYDVILPAGTSHDTYATKYIEMSGGTALFEDGSPHEWVLVNLLNGDYETFSADNWRLTGETSDRGDSFNPQNNHYWHSGGGFALMTSISGDPDVHISKGYPGRASAAGINLSDGLRWMALKSNLTAADLSIDAGIDDVIIGGIIEQRVPYFDIVTNISQLYDFVGFESESLIKMIRGAKNASYVADFEVPEIDLCSLQAGSPDDPSATSFLASRRAEQSLPTELECLFIDPAIDYAVNSVRAKRTLFPFSTTTGENSGTISVPLVLSASEALSRTTEALYRSWNAQIQYVLRLGPKYMKMEPGDLLEVTHDSTVSFMQVSSATLNADNSLSLVSDQYATEGEIILTQDEPLQDPNGIRSEYTELVLLDTNLIWPSDENEEALVVYVAAVSGGQSNWIGGAVYASVDGFFYQAGERHNTEFDLRGLATTDLSTFNWSLSMAHDWKNSVSGITINGDVANFSNATVSQLASDQTLNRFIIGAVGRWEIVQVGTFTDDGGGAFTLSDIVRGLRGTEGHMNDHAAGDTIISLGNRPPLSRSLFPVSAFENTGTFFALPVNAVSLNDALPTAITLSGNAEKPFSPTAVTATLSGSDIIIDWERRTRLFDDTTLIDGSGGTVAQPQLGEVTELYDLDIYNAAGTTIVHSEVDLTASTYTFTAAEITAAGFGATPTELIVDVYQKSDVVGRGHVKQVTLDVA
jgi:hypothetical protein